jgi:hypothetical protein
VILIAAAALGHALASLILCALVVTAALILEGLYWRARRGASLSAGRRAADTLARQDWAIGIGIPLAVAAVLLGTGTAAYRGYGTLTQGLALVFGVGFSIVIVSSLIDWYYILPRIAGEVCLQPCRSSFDPRWQKLTRIWYIHRGVAAITQMLVWLAAIPVILSRWVDPNQIAVIVAVVSAVAVTYGSGISATARMILYPGFFVGDLVRMIVPGGRTEGYLVDVSIEGVKVKETTRGTYTGPRFGPAKHTFKIDSAWLSWIEKADTPFHGCRTDCSGVNWYCRENPTAYGGHD